MIATGNMIRKRQVPGRERGVRRGSVVSGRVLQVFDDALFDLKKVLGEEADKVAVHGFLGVFLPSVIVVVAEDALDAEWVEHGLEGGAEAGVVDALAGTGSQ